MALSTSKQLLEALISLKENESKIQKELTKKIKSRKVKADKVERVVEEDDIFGDEEGGDEEKDEEGGDEEKDEEGGDEEKDEEGGDEEKDEEKGANKKLAGAEELIDTPQELPQTLRGNDFIDKINKIRAGASLNDKKMQSKIISYIKSLAQDERDDLWVNLDSLARIILGGLDPAEVLTPSLVSGPNNQERDNSTQGKPGTQKKQSPGANLPIVSPVTSVSEGVKRKLIEVPFMLKSNKTVPFGHIAHVRDLERMLSDLFRLRSCQERGSESYMAITLTIKTIKGQLAMALKKSSCDKSPVDGISTRLSPPLIEQD